MHYVYVAEGPAGHEDDPYDDGIVEMLQAQQAKVTRLVDGSVADDGEVIRAAPGGPNFVGVGNAIDNPRQLAWKAAVIGGDVGADGIFCRGWVLSRALSGNARYYGRLVLCISEADAADFVRTDREAQSAKIFAAAALVIAPASLHDFLLGRGWVIPSRLWALSAGAVRTDRRVWRHLTGDGSEVPVGLQLANALAAQRSILFNGNGLLAPSPESTTPDPATSVWSLGTVEVEYTSGVAGGALRVHVAPDSPMGLETYGRRVWRCLRFDETWPLAAVLTSDIDFFNYLVAHDATRGLAWMVATPRVWSAWSVAEWTVLDGLGQRGVNYLVPTSADRDELQLRLPSAMNGIVAVQRLGALEADDPVVESDPPTTGGPIARYGRIRGRSGAPDTVRRVLLASHDLKFCEPILRQLVRRDDLQVDVDHWPTQHAGVLERSRALLEEADVIWVDFASGAAEWFSSTVSERQRLIVRVHGYELHGPWADGIDFTRVNCVVFVSEHSRAEGCAKWGLDPARTRVIPNAVDCHQLSRSKLAGSRYTLGLLGWSPSLKRVDRAVALLEQLLQQDERFELSVKGASPLDTGWIWSDPTERVLYESIFHKLRSAPDLAARVSFEEHGKDVGNWFRGIGWILSPSDRESFHLAPIEGMASGAVPVVWPREGAEGIFPREVLVPNTGGAAHFVAATALGDGFDSLSIEMRKAARRFDSVSVVDEWLSLIG